MRKTLLLLVVVLSLIGGAAAAQEFPAAFCGELSEADCAILTESASAMRELESAGFHFALDFSLANIPEAEMDSLDFSLTGEGAYAIDPGVLDLFAMTPAGMSEMMGNMQMLPQMMETILSGISADATLVVFLPQNLPDVDEPLPEKVGVSMRLVDGVGYVNLDKLAELDTRGEMPRGWIGLDVAEFMNEAMAAQMEMLEEMPMGSMDMNMEMYSMFADPAFASSFMTITRGADTTVEGQQAAVFETDIDLDALFSSEAYQQMMRDQIETMMESLGEDSGLSSDDFEEIMGVYSSLFEGFSIQTTQTIGLDDHFVHSMGATLDWALDFSALAGEFGEEAPDMPPITLNVSFQAGLSQFNDAPTITAPEDATMVPLESLMGQNSF